MAEAIAGGSSGRPAGVALALSSAHHAPYPQVHPRIIQRIVEIREHPPENLHRTPGPRAILYYLPRDKELQAQEQPLARSTRTIWRVLRKFGCMLDAPHRSHRPQERPDPLEEIQLDFKDATSVPPDPDGKQQHMVEILNFVDAGTSTWLMAEARTDFHAETALEAVIGFLTQYGRPRCMTFDRDSRWVGSHSLRQSCAVYSVPKLTSAPAAARTDQPRPSLWRGSTGKPLLGKWVRMAAWMSMMSITLVARHRQANRWYFS